MAFLEKRGYRYRIIFRYDGQRFTHTLRTTDRREAETLKGGIEKTLMRLEQHLLAQIIQTWGMVWPPGESNLLCRQVFSTPPEATHEYTACLATAPRFLRTADHRGALPRRPDQ